MKALYVCVSYQVRDGAMSDLQTQLREVLRENELLRREVSIDLIIHLFGYFDVALNLNKEQNKYKLTFFFTTESQCVFLISF